MTTEMIIYLLLGTSIVCSLLTIFVLMRCGAMEKEMHRTRRELTESVNQSFGTFGDMIANNQKAMSDNVNTRLSEMNTRISSMAVENEQKLDQIRTSMETKITNLTADNNRQLDEMRKTVDEKLQKTLEDRISQSFKLVNDRLEQVYKGLGEMQTLAAGVGDLKKVLSNVKTRGILGEVQLSAILEQILAPDQYEENVRTKSSGNERVEFAVKLPGDGDSTVWLPIDAKFPGDSYAALMDAYDLGDAAAVEEAAKNLERVIKAEAKDIRDKYVEPPYTTDFGIMFLPFEGLYAEVVRRGLLEVLQRDYKVNIAGPTTMAALLNSLQMGFKTLAIQKHSSEVWEVLGAVKTEFNKFGVVLEATQKKINQANTELDKLIGVRTRNINKRLNSVTCLTDFDAAKVLELELEDN